MFCSRRVYCQAIWKYDLILVREVKLKVTWLCPTLCHPMDYTVHGILQARILECIDIPFSRGSSQPRGGTQVSHIAGGTDTKPET